MLLALERDDDAIGVFDGPPDIWGWCPGGEESDELAKDKFWLEYFDIFSINFVLYKYIGFALFWI